MGKPTGFMEYGRELPQKRPVSERVQDFREFVERYSDEKLDQQSARCMNCGVPFCHQGCPLGNVIPEFNDAVFRQDWDEAYQVLISTNYFPEFTGRICPAPCEAACVLGINQPAITIEEIEKHIIEIAFEKSLVLPRVPHVRSGKKVAVVGSGPAGLAAAAGLNYRGHLVTVYERDDAPGGLLRYGIPDFKLEKWVVDRRIRLMEEEGIVFKCNAEVGATISIHDLLRQHQAVVLAGGSTIPRDLLIPGREFQGIHFAMDFLKQQNKRLRHHAEKKEVNDPILATGKQVVVIGGGDTGSDCIGTAVRQGAAGILQLELLPKPPAERTSSMPWPSFPALLKTTSSHEEGAERQWAVTTKAFVGDEKGQLKALRVADLQWTASAEGRPAGFTEIPGTEREIPCNMALLAMGFLHPQWEGMLEQLEVEADERKNVKASETTYQTSIPRIFAAGDMRRGQSLVVWAIREGRNCAEQVHLSLSKVPIKVIK